MAKTYRRLNLFMAKPLGGKEHEGFALFGLPQVDAEADFDRPQIGVEYMSKLEELILGESHFFALNAAQLLYGMREQSEYPAAIERLLTGGRGESLRLPSAQAEALEGKANRRGAWSVVVVVFVFNLLGRLEHQATPARKVSVNLIPLADDLFGPPLNLGIEHGAERSFL